MLMPTSRARRRGAAGWDRAAIGHEPHVAAVIEANNTIGKSRHIALIEVPIPAFLQPMSEIREKKISRAQEKTFYMRTKALQPWVRARRRLA